MSKNANVEVQIYEINGEEVNQIGKNVITIKSHWNNGRMIEIELPDYKKITVSKNDLDDALNACTWSRY